MLCLLSTRELLSDAEPLASALREAQHPDAPIWQSLFQKCLPSARAERDGLIICQVASFCIAPGQAKGDNGARLRVRMVENEEQLEALIDRALTQPRRRRSKWASPAGPR